MHIYDTMRRQRLKFEPLTEGHINIYTCGQTVYNDIHIGNARFYVAFDAIRRYLMHRGYNVNFVQNFTDIDDKIIARASEEGKTAAELANYYITRTNEDLAALNVLPPTVAPRATETIAEMIEFIEVLIEKGFAYVAGGSVFFEVSRYEEYGWLSGKNIDELVAGARVEVAKEKKNPLDFVLWKPAKDGEPAWDSPWGLGRPGWHIECSAMAKKYIGPTIDIHGGAADLIFPHHENERAQSECANGICFSRYWLHCGILTTGRQKMSKSQGNFLTFRDVNFPADVVRFFLVSGHYRMPMEFNNDVLEAAAQGLLRIKNCYHSLADVPTDVDPTLDVPFMTAMDNDFNTADAVSEIFNIVKTANIALADGKNTSTYKNAIKKLMAILGIDLTTEAVTIDADIEDLINQRQAARAAKDFALADSIRQQLLELGVTLKDTRDGVTWTKA